MKSPKIIQTLKEKIGGKVSGKLSKLSYRQFIILLIAVCVPLFVVLMLVLPDDNDARTAQKKQQQQAKPKVETVKVVTANRDIPARTILREDMLAVKEVPNNILPDGYVTDSKQAINLPAAVAIQKGDVLTTKKFYADIKMAGFPGKIPDDCRAMSISISDATGVAGFAKPGDYVDIMSVDGKRGSKSMSGKLLLQNVLLLGINKSAKVEQYATTAPASKDGKQQSQGSQSGEGKTEDSGTSDSKDKDKKKEAQEPGSTASAQAMATATVAVTPADALKLAVASQTGTLYLALRPVVPKDTVVLDTEYIQETSGGGSGGSAEYDDDDYEENSGPNPYHRTYEERVAAYTPNASVPLPPTNETSAAVPSTSAPAQPEETVEIIRGTTSEKVRR